MRGCETAIEFVYYGKLMTGKCGSYYGGTMELCDKCYNKAKKQYPEGWRYYPGDCCVHGNYVGGIGIDRMCGPCESGDY